MAQGGPEPESSITLCNHEGPQRRQKVKKGASSLELRLLGKSGNQENSRKIPGR